MQLKHCPEAKDAGDTQNCAKAGKASQIPWRVHCTGVDPDCERAAARQAASSARHGYGGIMGGPDLSESLACAEHLSTEMASLSCVHERNCDLDSELILGEVMR